MHLLHVPHVSIILSKFGITNRIRSILRPSLAWKTRDGEGREERRRKRRRSRGGNPRRRYFRGGSGEKTVSKAQIVSPFPAERCTVHLKTSRLPVTARPRQFFIRYTQNASHLSSVSISSSASLFRGDGGPYRQKSESSFAVTVKTSEGIETFQGT